MSTMFSRNDPKRNVASQNTGKLRPQFFKLGGSFLTLPKRCWQTKKMPRTTAVGYGLSVKLWEMKLRNVRFYYLLPDF